MKQYFRTFAILCAATATLAHSSLAQAKYRVLFSFSVANDGGGYPDAGVLRDSAGNLYGTTEIGGASDYGTVYRLAPDGTFAILHAFAGEDGAYPIAGIVADAAGNLYGTTSDGGGGCSAGGCGTVFRVAPDGTESVLHAFAGREAHDGDAPYAGLAMDRGGNLYGTTSNGGHAHRFQDYGAVFKVALDGTETLLHSFAGPPDGTDGLVPEAPLFRDNRGNFYGTTVRGGLADAGTVFKIARGKQETLLYSFGGANDGAAPSAGVIADDAGNLYGMTSAGGAYGGGVVFRLALDGTETVLHAFAGGKKDGANPTGGLIADGAGNLFGVTVFGGTLDGLCPAGCGTIFKLASDGSETILHKFSYDEGAFPNGIVMDERGRFYGTTHQGGAAGYGTVFELVK
ncbi:MAG TPA: choice-of-anchor tandem repeat GloVer-containing protein [Rhizomicrobium sp.]|jgi:uncharacterized repeat protein (TIGR03803 family)|nr:choice-of-anchor tandem repeat GloVer-containing protein [Rhizomicrobium sp.]